MAYRDLRDFIRQLEKEGELKRISAEVDPVLEITEMTDRVTKAGGPALLFERPKGSKIPLLINMLGSERRMNLALEVEKLSDVADRINSYLALQSPQGLMDKLKMLPKLAEIGAFFPKTVKSGPCKEVIRKDNFSLHEFPVLKYCNVMEIGCAEKTCSEFENVSRGFSNRFYQTGQVGGIIKTGMSFKGHNVFPRILFATVSSFRAIQAYRGTFRL